MKFWAILLLVALVDPGKIGKVNEAKSEARKAFEKGDYATAVAKYKYLTDSLGVKEDALVMDLAHSYFNLADTTAALRTYSSLLNSSDRNMKSIAQQQMGVLYNRQKKFDEALNYFKEALKSNPSNEDARYNYEMVKKKLEDQKKKEQQQNKDQKQQDQKKDNKDQKDNKDKQDQQNKDDQQKKDKEQQEKDQKEQQNKEKQDQEKQQKEKQSKEEKDKEKEKKENMSSEKMKDMKISEEKAKMVLEAMKNQEIQYLQQNKRKATKPRSKGKPDW